MEAGEAELAVNGDVDSAPAEAMDAAGDEGGSTDDVEEEVLLVQGGQEEAGSRADDQHPQTPEFRAPLPPQQSNRHDGHAGAVQHVASASASPSSTTAPLQTAPAQVTPENNLANSDVMVKYRTAADIANEVLKRVLDAVRPGLRVNELCAYGDSLILESTSRVFKKSGVEKGIAKPTSIAVNNCLSNFAALEDDLQVLHHGDLVKIELAVHIDGYVAAAAHTTTINQRPDHPVTGRAADVVCAAYFGLEIALRTLKAGSKVSEVMTAISKVAQAFKCHTTIEPGHRAVAQMRRNVLEVRETRKRANAAAGTPGSPSRSASTAVTATSSAAPVAGSSNQVVPKATGTAGAGPGPVTQSADRTVATPQGDQAATAAAAKPAQTNQSRAKEEDHVFESGQVWTINVMMSAGDGKVKEKPEVKPMVYQRNFSKTFNLKLKVSRAVFNEISKRFGTFPFSLRALEDKRGRLGILECVQHNLLEPYPVYFDQSASFVAQFKCTVLIPPNSTMPLRVTSCPPLPYVHSEFSILNDRDMGAILRIPIKTVSNGAIALVSAFPSSNNHATVAGTSSKGKGEGAEKEGGRKSSKSTAGAAHASGQSTDPQ